MNASADLSLFVDDPDDVAPVTRFVVGLCARTMAHPENWRYYIREVATGAVVAHHLDQAETKSRYCELAGIALADFACRGHRPSETCGNCM